MNEIANSLKEWAQLVKSTQVTNWDGLPDIELYMDQVITYIEKQLSIYQEEEETKFITPSMINNYVKDGVIKHAVQKKYSKEHLAVLIMIGLLKQVLPLSQIGKITGMYNNSQDKKNIYDIFIKTQKESIDLVLKKVTEGAESDAEKEKERLLSAALKLSCDAFASRIAAERIIKMIEVNNKAAEQADTEKNDETEKNKKKEQKKDIKKDK